MTKIVKWYKRAKTWKVTTAILTPIASGEVIVYFSNVELPTFVNVLVGASAIILLYVKTFNIGKDDNQNGIADTFE